MGQVVAKFLLRVTLHSIYVTLTFAVPVGGLPKGDAAANVLVSVE